MKKGFISIKTYEELRKKQQKRHIELSVGRMNVFKIFNLHGFSKRNKLHTEPEIQSQNCTGILNVMKDIQVCKNNYDL